MYVLLLDHSGSDPTHKILCEAEHGIRPCHPKINT